MADTSSFLQRLILSAVDLKALTSGQRPGEPWPDALIEDYLNILRDLVLLADAIDEVSEDSLLAITRLNQLVAVLQSSFAKSHAKLNKLNAVDKKLEQLVYAW
jgi:uncharacterized small protein (DUF1192 family)